jgi:signal transduction histidine kinase
MDSKGVGLGLYVIKQLMTRMDGKISVESVVGEGTTFTLEFPAAAKGAERRVHV